MGDGEHIFLLQSLVLEYFSIFIRIFVYHILSLVYRLHDTYTHMTCNCLLLFMFPTVSEYRCRYFLSPFFVSVYRFLYHSHIVLAFFL